LRVKKWVPSCWWQFNSVATSQTADGRLFKPMLWQAEQEIWAQETRKSLWQFLFAGNLGLFPSILSQFTLLQPKIAKKNQLKLIFCGVIGHSRSFKFIDVDMTKKLVTGACCDQQHAHVYVQPFSRKIGQQW